MQRGWCPRDLHIASRNRRIWESMCKQVFWRTRESRMGASSSCSPLRHTAAMDSATSPHSDSRLQPSPRMPCWWPEQDACCQSLWYLQRRNRPHRLDNSHPWDDLGCCKTRGAPLGRQNGRARSCQGTLCECRARCVDYHSWERAACIHEHRASLWSLHCAGEEEYIEILFLLGHIFCCFIQW